MTPAASEGSAERTVAANGAELCVERIGEGPALLLIGNTMLSWPAELCERLALGGASVIRYDLRDTGRSTRVAPLAPAYDLRDLVGDAAALLGALDVGSADVAGFGPGGWIAQLLALDHPELVRSLTLVASRPVAPGRVDDDLPDHDPELMAALTSAGEPDWDDRDAVLEHLTRGAVRMAGGERDEAELRALVTAIHERTEASLAGDADRVPAHLADQMAFTFSRLDCGPRWRERLGEIDVPALVIHGADDPFFPPGNGAALASEIPGAELLVLDGVGSEMPRRAHARIAAAMLALIDRARRSD